MNMETASMILSSIAAAFVFLVVLIQLYSTIRPRFLKRVNCWFCNESSNVAYEVRNGWDCVKCEQYNGFAADGGYNKIIAAQHDIRLNSIVAVAKPKPVPRNSNGLCSSCNVNQELKVQQLATFVPFKPSHFDDEIRQFSDHLDHIYALCYDCEVTLARTLGKQSAWMLGLKLGAMRSKAWAKDQRISTSGLFQIVTRTFRIATAVIATTILATSLLQLDSLPPTYRQLIPPKITAVLSSVTSESRLLFLAVGCLGQVVGSVGRWDLKDVAATALWMAASGMHWARHLNVADSFQLWEAVTMSSLACCLLASFVAAFTPRKPPTLHKRPIRSDVLKPTHQSKSLDSRTAYQQPKKAKQSPVQSGGEAPKGVSPNSTRANSAAEDVSHLLHETCGNVPLPIGRSGAEDAANGPIRAPEGLNRGIGNLNIGASLPRRPLIEPSRFPSRPQNLLREADMFSPLSRSSSQSSGFASQSSQLDDADAPSRANPFYRHSHLSPRPDSANLTTFNVNAADSLSGRGFRDVFSKSAFGDYGSVSGKYFADGNDRGAYRASGAYPRARPSDGFSNGDFFDKPYGSKAGYPPSQAGDEEFAEKSAGRYARSGRRDFGGKGSRYEEGFYRARPEGSVRYDKDPSPNSIFSDRSYRTGFDNDRDSTFGNDGAAGGDEMALVSSGHYRDDVSVGSVGYRPVYLPPGFVVNQCCQHSNKLATCVVALGMLVNLVLFASNLGLWAKLAESFR